MVSLCQCGVQPLQALKLSLLEFTLQNGFLKTRHIEVGDHHMGIFIAKMRHPGAEPALLSLRMAGVIESKFSQFATQYRAYSFGEMQIAVGCPGDFRIALRQVVVADVIALATIAGRKIAPRLIDCNYAALVEEMAAAATSLKLQANDPVQTVAVFKLDQAQQSHMLSLPQNY